MNKIIIAALLLVSVTGCSASFRTVPAYGTTYQYNQGGYYNNGYYNNGRTYEHRQERREERREDRREERRWWH